MICVYQELTAKEKKCSANSPDASFASERPVMLREMKKCGRTKKPACVRVNVTEFRILDGPYTHAHRVLAYSPVFFRFSRMRGAGWRYDNRAGDVCLANGFNPIFIGK